MPDYLSREATSDFFFNCTLSRDLGVIDQGVLLDRLAALSSLGRRTYGSVVLSREILAANDWSLDEFVWRDDEDARRSNGNPDRRSHTEPSENRPKRVLFRLVTKIGGESWDFHRYDADWFPSVPHGHKSSGRPREKLDPYLGWVYIGSKQTRRLPRSEIVRLWNDDKFRDSARASISYYLEHFPQYTGWRVANPQVLPRRR